MICSLQRMSFNRKKERFFKKSHFWCVTLKDLFRSVLSTLNQCSIHHSMQNWSLYTNQEQKSWDPWTSTSKYPKYSKNHHFQNGDFSGTLCLGKCEPAQFELIITASVAHFVLYLMVHVTPSSNVSLKRHRSNTDLDWKCTFFIRHRRCSTSISSKEHFENEIFWVSRFL